MKTKKKVLDVICLLLITLWIYTSINKLMEYEQSQSQLAAQAMIGEYAGLLVWLLPALEILAAVLLVVRLTRKAGMLLSFLLMLLFTGYVGLVVAGLWENIPCSCGGVLNQLGWKEHLVFNLFFTLLAGMGIYLMKSQRKDGLKQAAFSG